MGVAFIPPGTSAMRASAAFRAICVQSKSCRSSAAFSAAGSAWQVIPMARAIFWSRASYRAFRTPSGASIAARSARALQGVDVEDVEAVGLEPLEAQLDLPPGVVGLPARELRGQGDLLAARRA